MQNLQKKISSYITTGICYSVLMIVLGLVLLIFPGVSLDIIRWSLAIILIIAGMGMVINDLRRQTVFSMFSGSLLGVFLLVMGIIIVIHPDVLAIVPIILGAWMIVSSFFTLRLTSTIKNTGDGGFWISFITSMISIICGFILIFHPMSGAVALTSVLGAVIIVYAIAGLIDLIVFRRNLDEVARGLKNTLKVVEDKEAKLAKAAKDAKEGKVVK